MKSRKFIGVILAVIMGLSCLTGLTACGSGSSADYPDDFQAFLDSLDTDFSYEVDKTISEMGDDPALGFRSAGSPAERETAGYIRDTMEDIGLENVTVDKVNLDGWIFNGANITFTNADGEEQKIDLGGYQTTIQAENETIDVVYLNKGTAEDYGCNCVTTPTKRTADIKTSLTEEGVVFVGNAEAVDDIGDDVGAADLTKKSDGVFTITAQKAGTTDLTVTTTLRDWVSAEKTYTINVEESEEVVKVVDFDAETTHAGFDDGSTETVQTLFVELTFEKEMEIVDKAALLEEMNVLSDSYVNATQNGSLEEGKNFVVFGAGLKPEQTDVELTNDNKTLKITTSGWGAQVAGIFRAAGTWENLRSIDGERADVDVEIIIPNGITTEIVEQVIATEDTNASVTTKVIRPADATRGMVHWMLLKNGEPVKANYDGEMGFNQVGATFNAHLHNYASDTAVDFARNSATTMMPILGDSYDIVYEEGSDEITVTAKDSEPGDSLEMHIYSYLNNGSKTNDLSTLNSVLSEASDVDGSLYTAGSYAALSDALAQARLVANVPTYYAQTDIDYVTEQLQAAQNDLVALGTENPGNENPNNDVDQGGRQNDDTNNDRNNNQSAGNGNSGTANNNTVQTGDEFPIGILGILLAMAACVAGGTVYSSRRSAR